MAKHPHDFVPFFTASRHAGTACVAKGAQPRCKGIHHSNGSRNCRCVSRDGRIGRMHRTTVLSVCHQVSFGEDLREVEKIGSTTLVWKSPYTFRSPSAVNPSRPPSCAPPLRFADARFRCAAGLPTGARGSWVSEACLSAASLLDFSSAACLA